MRVKFNPYKNMYSFICTFLIAILHRDLRHGFFYLLIYFPYPIWTFISIFYLDFRFPFLFGLLIPSSIWSFFSFFYLEFYFSFRLLFLFLDFYFPFRTNRDLILDFLQVFWFDLFLGASAEILEKISFVFWKIWRRQKDNLKLTYL